MGVRWQQALSVAGIPGVPWGGMGLVLRITRVGVAKSHVFFPCHHFFLGWVCPAALVPLLLLLVWAGTCYPEATKTTNKKKRSLVASVAFGWGEVGKRVKLPTWPTSPELAPSTAARDQVARARGDVVSQLTP